MMRSMIAAAALALCAVVPAQAQDAGGIRLRGPDTVLDRLDSFDRSGCRLSATSVTLGVNRALSSGSQAQQSLSTNGSGGCRPLVSTQATVGVNLALGSRSRADQSIETSGPRGLLATTTLARGVNIAGGARSGASQRILAQTVR
jgi:hypothetical protein